MATALKPTAPAIFDLQPLPDELTSRRCSVMAYLGDGGSKEEQSYTRQVEGQFIVTTSRDGAWPEPTYEIELDGPIDVQRSDRGCTINLKNPHELIGLARLFTLLAEEARRQELVPAARAES